MTSSLSDKTSMSNNSMQPYSPTECAAITRSLAMMLGTASEAENGLQKTPQAVVSRGDGRQRFTPTSPGS